MDYRELPEHQRRELRTCLGIIAAGLGLVAVILALAHQAKAHGPAEWIQFNPTASWCCNENDCLRRSPDFARETANGWVIKSTGQVFREGDRGLFRSIDADIWACEQPDKQIRCLFVPGSGA